MVILIMKTERRPFGIFRGRSVYIPKKRKKSSVTMMDSWNWCESIFYAISLVYYLSSSRNDWHTTTPTAFQWICLVHYFQVRKTSQAALLVLMEQELVDKGKFFSSLKTKQPLCVVLVQLFHCSTDYIDTFRTECDESWLILWDDQEFNFSIPLFQRM